MINSRPALKNSSHSLSLRARAHVCVCMCVCVLTADICVCCLISYVNYIVQPISLENISLQLYVNFVI